jgi:cystathionine beta-lyase/cystathionine gamma-synthase
MKKRTRVTHLPEVEIPPDNRALVAPIYQSVKFTFDDVAETGRYYDGRRAGFYYSRVSNPTLRQLENALAELQGRDACLLTASGMAAISASLLSLTKQGDQLCTSQRCTSRRAALSVGCSVVSVLRAACCRSTTSPGWRECSGSVQCG